MTGRPLKTLGENLPSVADQARLIEQTKQKGDFDALLAGSLFEIYEAAGTPLDKAELTARIREAFDARLTTLLAKRTLERLGAKD